MSDRIEITKFDLMLFSMDIREKNEINFVIFYFFIKTATKLLFADVFSFSY